MKFGIDYYEIERRWPEHFASVALRKNASSRVSHLDIYKGKCEPDYLTNFRMMEFSPGRIPDMLPNNLGWPIVSGRCCKFFREIDAEVKATLHPIRAVLLPSCPPELADYCLLSASLVLDCLDLGSDGIRWHDESRQLASSYSKLRFLGSSIPEGVSFFGVKRVPCAHIVSAALADALMSAHAEGFSFRPCEVPTAP